MDQEDIITLVFGTIAILVCLGAVIISQGDILIVGYGIVIGISIFLVPWSILKFTYQQKMSEKEDNLPKFLRNLSDAHEAGMTLPIAILNATKTDYGALNEDVKKMANQLSWGIPLPNVIKNFAKRNKKSIFIRRAIGIVIQAYYAGGAISEAMGSVSEATRLLKKIANERQSILKEQITIIYIINLLFIGIIVALYRILIPLLSVGGGAGGALFISGGSAPSVGYFKILFFLTMTIQSFMNGLVAGEAKDGSVVAGVKHSFIMLVIALVAFSVLIYPKIIDFNAELSDNVLSSGEKTELTGSIVLEGSPVSNTQIFIILENLTEVIKTDEQGEFSYSLIAPQEVGVYEVLVIAKMEGEKDESRKIQLAVTGAG
ncbi:MAG: hypothetical protein GOU97_02315 [Nanoarchaeota archaeon]|nr:hypothetical protein [Nanoarchaeota archaeon]